MTIDMKKTANDIFFATDSQINSIETIMIISLITITQINYICLRHIVCGIFLY